MKKISLSKATAVVQVLNSIQIKEANLLILIKQYAVYIIWPDKKEQDTSMCTALVEKCS